MVIGIIGENCSGKSTLAEAIKKEMNAEIITGRDYLRMAKSESEAVALFKEKLLNAVSGDNIIYVASEQEQVNLLPEGAVRILVYADLDTIKERFKARMHGNLPAPVAQMLEKKHGIFDNGTYDYRFDGANGDTASLAVFIMKENRKDAFVKETARKVLADLDNEDKKTLMEDPDPATYHFGLGLYIRNEFIHGKDLGFRAFDYERLSGEIIEEVIRLCREETGAGEQE